MSPRSRSLATKGRDRPSSSAASAARTCPNTEGAPFSYPRQQREAMHDR
jgi:hypothetical protein